jgi:hypothetical protein
MDNVLIELNKVLDEGRFLVDSLRRQKDAQDRAQQEIDKRLGDLRIKESLFTDRESQIVTIENFNSLRTAVEKKNIELSESINAFRENVKKFEAYRQGEISRIDEIRKTAQVESDNLDKQRKYIENLKKENGL